MKLLLFGIQCRSCCERGGVAVHNLNVIVREKARDPGVGRVSPGCRCLHPGSSLGCGRAHLCSLEIHKDNSHISPHPPAPL